MHKRGGAGGKPSRGNSRALKYVGDEEGGNIESVLELEGPVEMQFPQ